MQAPARTGRPKPADVDAPSLAAALGKEVAGEVRFDDGSRALYASDLSIYRQVPIGVVVPRDVDDVMATVELCRRHGAPILGRGAGTSLAGQGCNVAVIIDFSKYMNGIVSLDADNAVANVQPGVINDQLQAAAKDHGLTFAPDPATHSYCTIGGQIGNNACGVHSVMGGRTSDNVDELDILTYDGLRLQVSSVSGRELESIVSHGGRTGHIYAGLKSLRDRYAGQIMERYPRIPRRVSGYNLDELLPHNDFNLARALVGTESTCAIVLGATVRLIPSPPKRTLVVIGYPDPGAAGDDVADLMGAFEVTGLEAVHTSVVENLRTKGKPVEGAGYLPAGSTWLYVELGGDTQKESNARAKDVLKEADRRRSRPAAMFDDPIVQAKVWAIRESGVGSSHVPGTQNGWPSWEDSAVPPERLGDYMRDFDRLIRDRYGYPYTLFGHFGQGCIHTRIDFDLKTNDGIQKFRSYMYDAADLVVDYGGSLSGEHGDGQARAELLPKMFGGELVNAFREFKTIWDPDNKMNPGKVVDAYFLDENLRLGADYKPAQVQTHFKFTEDDGSFSLATERCFGIGLCRRLEGATMCPSFRVTREEMHTTRGRTRLLFEMLRGETITDGWKSEAVKESLDLCLACKGCKGDCPVSVDVATYKAEFLSHYYEGRRRPLSAYAMGLIYKWARLASRVPRTVNFFTQTPGLRRLVTRAAGLARERRLPRFATQTFKEWFARRPRVNAGGPRVILWPDTFNNYFTPEVAKAAVEVLEAGGFEVDVPEPPLCCGRPLYDYGMLDTAERQLEQILDFLREDLHKGTPVIGLEPSCVAVFRDELGGLFPTDEDARRLGRQMFLLSEFIVRRDPEFELPSIARTAVVQGHCHQEAIMGMEDERAVLERLGLDFEILDSGCCGMAGSFGYEEDNYEVSVACGEEVLLPAVRRAPKDSLIVADGFSCRAQIEHGTGRRALHLAEVIQMAMRKGRKRRRKKYLRFLRG